MSLKLRFVGALAVVLALGTVSYAATQDKAAQDKAKAPAADKWTGTISDAMCGKSHGDKGGTMQKDHECTITCAKTGSFVFVVGDKIYKIADQKMADLTTHAGHKVEIAGTMKGDTITVTKVTMLPVAK
jgi:hypothetical protein